MCYDKSLRSDGWWRSLARWSSAAGSGPRAARSSKACTSPTAKRGCAGSSRRRACLVLGAPAAGAARSPAPLLALPRRTRFSTREFLVFNQELATLLKAGHAARPVARHPAPARHEPGLQGRCSTTCTSGSGRAARCPRRSRRTARCFPGVYTASLLAGEKSGNLEQVIRRYVAYVKVVASVRRRTISALVYPGDPVRAVARRGRRSSC